MMLSGEDTNKLLAESYSLYMAWKEFNTTLNNASVLDEKTFFMSLCGCVRGLEVLLPEIRNTIDYVEHA